MHLRKNKEGEWELYDPEDGYRLVKNLSTGRYDRYDEDGFRVVTDQFGNTLRYDEEGYVVNVLPDGGVVRYDS